MDMINWLSQQGKVNEVTAAIQKLSRFYKLTLSRKQSLSTIADEIEHVSIYVQLQNMRFHDTIDFLIDVPDLLTEYTIPKLTFQPVVENSILHGILEKEDKQGTIVLTGWIEENVIVILISDNGTGIDPEDIHHIFKRFYRSKHSLDTQGIGLGLPLAKSIIEGQGGVISVQSEIENGTTFTLSFLTES